MRQLTEKQKQYLSIKKQISELKGNLYSTDYQAIKYAEGEMSEEEFETIKAKRRLWRSEINRLEAELVELKRSVKN